jgi:hypothetical protein
MGKILYFNTEGRKLLQRGVDPLHPSDGSGMLSNGERFAANRDGMNA